MTKNRSDVATHWSFQRMQVSGTHTLSPLSLTTFIVIYRLCSCTIFSLTCPAFSNQLTVGILIRFCLDLNRPIISLLSIFKSVILSQCLSSPINSNLHIQCPAYPFIISLRSSAFSTSHQPLVSKTPGQVPILCTASLPFHPDDIKTLIHSAQQ